MRSLALVLRLAGVFSTSTTPMLLPVSSRSAMNPPRIVRSISSLFPDDVSGGSVASGARFIRSQLCFVSPSAIGTTPLSSTSTSQQTLGIIRPRIARYSHEVRRSSVLPFPLGWKRLLSSSPAVSLASAEETAQHTADGEVRPSLYKVNLLELDEREVEDFFKGLGEPKYRAKQVLKWMYEGAAESFEDMTNIPKALRAKLTRVATVGALKVAAQQVSKDGTKKVAYRLGDGQMIESVLMPYSDGRRTACISSQAGCAMGCVFCATGQMGFKRQLSSSEIFEQAYRFSQELAKRGDRLSNVVFMGMGEPLANYNSVMEAVRRINAELGIGARHITISTVGLVPRILRLSQENIQVKLAVSLHAANDRERGELLPVNRRFPLSELMSACREYVDVSGRRMSFEWALIQGENDSPEVAAELGRLLRPLKGMCHVNIIPLNPTEGYKGGPSMADAVEQFVGVLARHGVVATPRMRRGIDIDAGCGQLTVKIAQDSVLGKGM